MPPHSNHQFSFWVTVAFTVNYTMGTGFLTLPWAFYEAGIGLSVSIMFFVAVLSALSTFFVLESMERAKLYNLNNRSKNETNEYTSCMNLSDGESFESGEINIFIDDPSLIGSPDFTGNISSKAFYDISELCDIFLGNQGRNFYNIFLSIYIFGSLTAYCSVFAESLAVHTPFFESSSSNYKLYLSIFFTFMIPVSCLDLNEQIEWQVLLAFCRLVMVIVMLWSVLAANADTDPDADGALSGFMFTDFPDAPYGAPMFNWSGLITILPLSAFANIFHHSIPALSSPVKNKNDLGSIFLVAIFSCFFAFTSIGVFLAVFFGKDIPSSTNLAWKSFIGSSNYSMIATLVQYYVVLFPALDVASAFPLNVVTLGNSLFLTFKSSSFLRGPWISSWIELRILFRIFVAIPPFIMAVTVTNLENITTYTGLPGFALSMVFPALLAYSSKVSLRNKRMSYITKFSNTFSGDFFILFLLLSGLVFTLLVSITIV